MTERVRINATREDRQSVAQKLLDAAGDDLQVVRVSGNGFVVPKSVAEKAGLLEPSKALADDDLGNEKGPDVQDVNLVAKDDPEAAKTNDGGPPTPGLAEADGDSVTSPDTAADSAEAGVQEPVVAEPKPAKATKR